MIDIQIRFEYVPSVFVLHTLPRQKKIKTSLTNEKIARAAILFFQLVLLKMNMAGNRKKGDYSVLSEINTEEEWITLLERNVSTDLNYSAY